MKAIYPNPEGGLSIVMPAPHIDESAALDAEAKRVIPAGTPYLLVQDSDLPEDWSLSGGWSADFSNPDGYGEKGA